MADALTLRTDQDVIGLIGGTPHLMACLHAIAGLVLPDCWIGAGAIRNLVWDTLHGFAPGLGDQTDVDVVFFDPGDLSADPEVALEKRLRTQIPGVDWQVRNQARMHLRNGDPVYRDTEDGLRHWPETATAIAARLKGRQIELLAPFGLDDLLGLVVRPTPRFTHKMEIYRARQAAKNWIERWPELSFVD